MAQALQLRRQGPSELSRSACPDCLRRAWLLAARSPPTSRRSPPATPGSRSPELLRALQRGPGRGGRRRRSPTQVLAQGRGAPRAPTCAASCERRSAGPAAATTTLYPAGLRDAADAPWALIGRGDPGLLDGLEPDGAVTIVGARRASSYGREVARELGRELAARRAGRGQRPRLRHRRLRPPRRARRRPHDRRARLRRRRRLSRRAPLALAADLRSRAWSSPSCRRGRRPGAGPSRPATGSWRRWRG